MAIGLGSGTTSEFFETEFSTLNLGDKRLNSRAKKLLCTMQRKLTTCVKRMHDCQKDMRQTYDFFSNPKVEGGRLLKPHCKQTIERVKQDESNYILSIQDSTTLNYSSHLAKTEIGRTGSSSNKKHLYGLFQHTALLVSNQNEPLGMLDVRHYDNDDFQSKIPSDRRPLKEKKSCVWVETFRKVREQVKTTGKRVITVADREGDFFEYLHEFSLENDDFVIRAKHDRCTGLHQQKGPKLSALLAKQAWLGKWTVEVNEVETHQINPQTFQIKALENVTLPVPRWAGQSEAKGTYQPIQVNVIEVCNDEYSWTLLTNRPVDNLKACVEVINIYKQRWHIEDYHKVLKTGYQVEKLYLHASRQAIINALIMASISACRLYWLIFVGRVDGTTPANQLFQDYEWKSVYAYFNEAIPEKAPSLEVIILQIARLGGYKIRKTAGPPGVKLMWMGFQHLSVAAKVYKNLLSV